MPEKNTHIVTRPNTRAPINIDQFRLDLAKDYQKQIKNYFGGDKQKALKFMSAVIYSVQKTPKLLECSKESLLQAFMSCAEFQLYPSGVSGEAFVLPYNSKNGMQAQFQLGYQGIITLLWRAGVKVTSQIINENDTFEYAEGLEPKLVHKFDPFKERGEAIGVYAIAEMADGRKLFKVMSKAQIMEFKEFSKAKDSPYSPWNSAQDPELWMWMKTDIKQLSKTLPKTEELQKAIAKDNEDSIVGDRKSDLNPSGPAVGAALHVPEEKAGALDEDAERELAEALAKENQEEE